MQTENYYSDDYAGLTSGNLQFYYGYEVEDPESQDWCFQVKKDGKEIFRMSRSKIRQSVESDQLDGPRDYLIAGIGLWLLLK